MTPRLHLHNFSEVDGSGTRDLGPSEDTGSETGDKETLGKKLVKRGKNGSERSSPVVETASFIFLEE